MWPAVLIDSCVMMDAILPFRQDHERASTLLGLLAKAGTVCYIPSHAYFECAVAVITHFKYNPEKLKNHPIDLSAIPNLELKVVTLNDDYVNELWQGLLGKPIPDLKSQDLIYFCVARNRGMPLITQDKKLRKTSRKGGIPSLNIDEALEALGKV